MQAVEYSVFALEEAMIPELVFKEEKGFVGFFVFV